jgi:glycosyltransferase involved in cell wall biosynthesis
MIRTIRNVLPDAAIVYTLHEYLPLCHRDGQLLKTDGTLCGGPSPRGCNGCFPEIAPQAFFLRERFIKAQLTEVDRFICPSEFLLETYARWGIPRDKLVHEPNGRHQVTPLVRSDNGQSETGRPRNRFGYFGQFTKYKGADVLLEAMSLLAERPDQHGAQLVLHGANLEHAPPEFQQRFAELLDANSDTVRLHGRYRPKDLPLLMSEVDWVIAPSRWYENAPLVIQEAFQHGRPVLCSDIGGLAEAVTDGVDGLHFAVGSATALADTLVRAATTPGLWDTLSAGVRAVRRIDDHVAALQEVYQQALAGRRPSTIGPGTNELSASKARTSKASIVRPSSGRTRPGRARLTQAGATQPSTELTSVPS